MKEAKGNKIWMEPISETQRCTEDTNEHYTYMLAVYAALCMYN